MTSFRTALAAACLPLALAACTAGTMPGPDANSLTMNLATLQQQVQPGMSEADVLSRIGRPSYTFPVGWQKQVVWNYRFARPEGDCVVFQVSFDAAARRVAEVGQGYDRTCDGPDRS